MYIETQVQPPITDTAARGPVVANAVSTLRGHVAQPPNKSARFFLNVTAATGTTPSMTLNIYNVINGVAYFVAQFAAVTVAGQYSVNVPDCGDLVCFAPAPLTGTTPSFTYEVWCAR